jgi:hypothetical protein
MHIRTYFFTTFSILVDISYPSAGTVFSKDGVFQQPREITTVVS